MSLTNTQIGLVIAVVLVVGYLIYSSRCSEGFAPRIIKGNLRNGLPTVTECKNIINNQNHPQYTNCKNKLKNYCAPVNMFGLSNREKYYCTSYRHNFN